MGGAERREVNSRQTAAPSVWFNHKIHIVYQQESINCGLESAKLPLTSLLLPFQQPGSDRLGREGLNAATVRPLFPIASSHTQETRKNFLRQQETQPTLSGNWNPDARRQFPPSADWLARTCCSCRLGLFTGPHSRRVDDSSHTLPMCCVKGCVHLNSLEDLWRWRTINPERKSRSAVKSKFSFWGSSSNNSFNRPTSCNTNT